MILNNANPVIFVPTKDPEKSKIFFTEILELELIKEDSHALVFQNSQGILRIIKVDDFTPSPFTLYGWEVENILSVTKALMGKGLNPITYNFLEQDNNGIWQSPEGAYVVWFNDVDDNIFSMTQEKR